MEPRIFDRLQQLTPGSDIYRKILSLFERHTLSGVMARLLTEEDPVKKEELERSLRELLR
ncbi:MAG: hypothetical protein ACLGH0_14890 [Thermoanaerobaculia bacterium]